MPVLFSHRKLASLRKERSLSQQQLADLIGAHLVTISKLETGKTPLTANWILRFANALDIDPAEIDPGFSSRQVFKVTKSVTELGNILENPDAPVVALEEPEVWADRIEWIKISGDSLMPALRRDDLCKIAYDKRAASWAYIDRMCLITIEGTYAKTFEIIATPVAFRDEKVDFAHVNGVIVRQARYYDIGVIVAVYPRGATGGLIAAEHG